MICSQPSVGVASSDSKQPTGMSANLRARRTLWGGPRFSVGVAWLNLAEIVGKHVLAGPASRASELEVINVGEVSRKADARVDEDDMQEPRLMGIQLCVNF